MTEKSLEVLQTGVAVEDGQGATNFVTFGTQAAGVATWMACVCACVDRMVMTLPTADSTNLTYKRLQCVISS